MSTSWPFQSIGNSSHPTLIFLHGFLGRGADWLPVAKELASEFRCLLPDLPGHGANTDLDPTAPLTFDRLAGDLARTLDTAGAGRPVLIGYSLGGRLALHFACRFPGRLSALVLESASPGLRTEQERSARRALDDARAAQLLQAGLPGFLKDWYRAGLWESLRTRPDLLAPLVRARSDMDPAWAAKTIADLSPGRMAPLWDRLPALRVPTLLLAGSLDPDYRAIAAETAARIPGSEFVCIEDAGHNIHLEQPGLFAGTLRGFIEPDLDDLFR
ncbi:MAG TPA: 2-succinyl-6-hydroxy-2,4-cyclohexadiene-1-carboxylate synthase [Anaerolineales bacterium]|nr:2-succinyl-6-hydroxy-2,4-cyclohexadiene-1-carboxylate synthase [Anaerolineales bacterium]